MRRLTLGLANEAALEQVAATGRLAGMRRVRTTYELVRETWYDAGGRELAAAGLALRVRIHATGRRVVELVERDGVNLGGVVEERVFVLGEDGCGLYEALRGESPGAVRVCALVPPEALRPVVAVDVDREIQDLRPGFMGPATHRAFFDRLEVHLPAGARRFHQITIEETEPGRLRLEDLPARLGDLPVVSRRDARDLATDDPAAGSEPSLRGRHPGGLAVVAVSRGAVALHRTPEGYGLPSSTRAGEQAAAALASDLFAAPAGAPPDVDLVGFATRTGGVDLEVWLAEGVAVGARPTLTWVPLRELLERVGAPGLRSPALVESLLLLARSRLGVQLLQEAGDPHASAVVLRPVERDPSLAPGEDPEDFLDGDLSILDFNLRVLEMAEDSSLPIMERVRFLSIFARNLDEFFVVRVGRLKTHAERGAAADDAALPPPLLLDAIAVRVRAVVGRQYACYRTLCAALADRGLRVRRWSQLDDAQRSALKESFHRELFPLLTPRAMTGSSGQPFPRVESLSLSLAALVLSPGATRPHVAHVPVPASSPRWIRVPDSGDVIAVEDVVAANVNALFPAAGAVEAYPFRVSRLGDVTVDSDLSESLLEAVADEVEDRRYKPVIRLEVGRSMPREVRAHLLRELRAEAASEGALLQRGDIYEVDGPVDLGACDELARFELEGGSFPPFVPRVHPVGVPTVFDAVAKEDLLLHHPYDSFDASVGRFLQEAAHDPGVVSIRMTLYRVGRDSPVVGALLDALAAGKDVSVFVELQARFDEERNIEWTHRLRDAGGHVVYGVPGYKAHAKVALVVRREADGRLVRYSHVATGNYNAATARFYTDVGLVTSDPELGAELNDFFNELTGSVGAPMTPQALLWVAPHGMADSLLDRIEGEIGHARAGRSCGIRAKMNGLSDRAVNAALYRASQEGVPVDLAVRALCTLRPGVEGLSEGIRVRSILGRFLEHARIYRFENGGQPALYIGSADWRKRNLRRRVEVAAPVRDPGAVARLESLLDAEFEDGTAWVLGPDGRYRRSQGGGPPAQAHFMAMAADPGTPRAPR
ncbi:MAG: polyphosphate kinase 1 [Longimicrobiales bacterium]